MNNTTEQNKASLHLKKIPHKNDWDANLYDGKHAFVSKYGEELVDILEPQAGENILDLGCGTGYLAHLISESGAHVIGIDNSKEMIDKAQHQYPGIDFRIMDAEDFNFKSSLDAVFSNAALHWVLNKQKAIESMFDSLKTGGRLVLEMGGKDNVNGIVSALKSTLVKHGYVKEAGINTWYFPSLSAYTSLLESKGFRVTYAAHYDRETKLQDNDNGIKDWLKMFGGAYLKGINESETEKILDEVQANLKDTHFREGNWYADYKRLRIVAIKK